MAYLIPKDGRLNDETDLAIGFLREFFYADWALVDLLLERGTDELSLTKSIVNYVRNRFIAFNDVTADDIRSFESRSITTGADDSKEFSVSELKLGSDVSHAANYHYDAAQGSRGRERVKELAKDLSSQYTASDPDYHWLAEGLSYLDRELFNTRHLVDLGACEVDIDIKAGKCAVRLDGRELLQGLDTAAADGRGREPLMYATTQCQAAMTGC